MCIYIDINIGTYRYVCIYRCRYRSNYKCRYNMRDRYRYSYKYMYRHGYVLALIWVWGVMYICFVTRQYRHGHTWGSLNI